MESSSVKRTVCSKRYRYTRDERGKTPNKAKVAVVNELVRWIWVIGRMVEGEQAA